MKQTFVRKVNGWYSISECVFTKEGEKLMNDKDFSQLSDEWKLWVFAPYNSTLKTNVADKKYVAVYSNYFKQKLD